MGEKIRDIRPIKIGKTSLMIELNEGYTKDEGKLIHIQNQKFRYLLRLTDFYSLASLVLRGWSEFSYNKKRIVKSKKESDFGTRQQITTESQQYYKEFTKKLSIHHIDYRVLDIQDKLLTIIVSEECMKAFDNVLVKSNLTEVPHPFGVDDGYVFLYQMKPFRLFSIGGKYIEVYCQLPCASITPKSWIPVDRVIQKRVWDEYEIKNGIIWCDEVCCYIYHLCWAIFHNNGFSSFERQYFDSNKQQLHREEIIKLFKVIFFNFTDTLVNLLRNSDFDSIIPQYFSFIDY